MSKEIALEVLEDQPLCKTFRILETNSEILAAEKVAFISVDDPHSNDQLIMQAVLHFFGKEIKYHPNWYSYHRDGHQVYIVFSQEVLDARGGIGWKIEENIADEVHAGHEYLAIGPISTSTAAAAKRAAIKFTETDSQFSWEHANKKSEKMPLFRVEVDEKRSRIDLRAKHIKAYPRKTGMVRLYTLESWIVKVLERHSVLQEQIADSIPRSNSWSRDRGNYRNQGYSLHLRADVNKRLALIIIVRRMVEELAKGIQKYGDEKYDPLVYRLVETEKGYNFSCYQQFLMEAEAALPEMGTWAKDVSDLPEGNREAARKDQEWFHEFCKQEVADSKKGP